MARRSSKPPSDIDPEATDVIERKRRRKLRNKPEPSPMLKAEELAALARAKSRHLPPAIMFEPNGRGGYDGGPSHSDQNLWDLQIADAFGTRSQAVMTAFLRDLQALCGQDWDEANGRWKPDETLLNAALAMVADVRPRDTAEAALAAQMVAVHMMQMRLSAQALNRGGMIVEQDAALAGKMARTYAMLMQTLQTMRGGKATNQTITVKKELHSHVHYHRGEGENGRQSHRSPATQLEGSATVQGDEPGGKVLRLPSRKGQGGV